MDKENLKVMIPESQINETAVQLRKLRSATPIQLSKRTGIRLDRTHAVLKVMLKHHIAEKIPKNPDKDQRFQEYRLTKTGQIGADIYEFGKGFHIGVRDDLLAYFEQGVKRWKKVKERGKVEPWEEELEE